VFAEACLRGSRRAMTSPSRDRLHDDASKERAVTLGSWGAACSHRPSSGLFGMKPGERSVSSTDFGFHVIERLAE